MDLVFGVDKLSVKRGPYSKIFLINAIVVDYFFVSVTDSDIKEFFDNLNRSFYLRATSQSLNLRFLGCTIVINYDGLLCMIMDVYLSNVLPYKIPAISGILPV